MEYELRIFWKWTIVGVISLLLIAAVARGCQKAASTAEEVALTAIESDEMFNEMYQSIQKQGGTCQAYYTLWQEEPNSTNKQVWLASTNKLRTLIADYNAKAGSFRREYFRTTDMPENIDPEYFIQKHSK